jgi:integrase
VQRGPLTDLAIKSVQPPAKGYSTLWDGSLKGFGVMVSQGGSKSYCVLVASGRRKVIGKVGLLSLADARRIAREMLAEKVLKKRVPSRVAFDDAKAEYLLAIAKKNKPRTHKDYTRLLNRHFPFGRKNLADITPREVLRCLPSLDTPIERKYAHAVGKAFFRWCTRQHYITASPMANLETPQAGQSRERVLSDAELKAIWQAAGARQGVFPAIVQLLVLTGQRRSEIASLRWEWVDETERTITLPSSATKNRRTHTFPYGEGVASILAGLPRLSDTYVFPAARESRKGKPCTVFNGWSKAKLAFDKECGVEKMDAP